MIRRTFRASHVGDRVRELKNDYHEEILMWCKEEILEDGRKLTEVINEKHENVKYLPNRSIPDNVIAVADLLQTVNGANILIFVIPHQFVKETCETLKGHVRSDAFALTLIKVRRKPKSFSFVESKVEIFLFVFPGFLCR